MRLCGILAIVKEKLPQKGGVSFCGSSPYMHIGAFVVHTKR